MAVSAAAEVVRGLFGGAMLDVGVCFSSNFSIQQLTAS